MNYNEIIDELIQNQNGTILTSDITHNGVPRTYLALMVASGKLVKVSRGIYVKADGIEDEMYAMQNKYKKLIYSHETALFLHGLSDRTPFEYSATVPSGYKAGETLKEQFKLYYIKKDLHDYGVITVKNTFGNNVKVYDIERTICDLIRSKNRIDIQIFTDAMKRIPKIKKLDYQLIMKYATQLGVANELVKYMEVLL